MKTIVKTGSKALVILFFFNLLVVNKGFSQVGGWVQSSKHEYIIQVNQLMNGTGHGMITDFDIAFKAGRNEVAAGAFMQSKYLKISGASLQYKNFLTFDKYTNLYMHYTFMYHSKNFLSDNLNEAFHPGNYEKTTQYERFNTIAQYIGVGVESMTLQDLYIDIKFGVGGYLSKIVGTDNRNLNIVDRDDKQVACMLSMGISYHFESKGKTRKFHRF